MIEMTEGESIRLLLFILRAENLPCDIFFTSHRRSFSYEFELRLNLRNAGYFSCRLWNLMFQSSHVIDFNVRVGAPQWLQTDKHIVLEHCAA